MTDDDLLGPEPGELPATVDAETLADLLSLTANRVNSLAREGVIPRTGRRYPLRDVVRCYVEWSRANPVGRRIADPTLADQKLRLAREQADKLALQNARARDELLDAGEVGARWAAHMTDLRGDILAVPARIAARLGLDRPAASALDAEIRSALAQIAQNGSERAAGGRVDPEAANDR